MLEGKYIYLTEEQQEQLKYFVKNGRHNSHEIMRARVLLLLDRTGKVDHVRYKRISECTGLSVQAVYNMRDDFIKKQDIEAYLSRKVRETPSRKPALNGEEEAKVIALACSKAPEGYARWTVRLLTAKAIELHFIGETSHMTIQRLLKKRNISLT